MYTNSSDFQVPNIVRVHNSIFCNSLRFSYNTSTWMVASVWYKDMWLCLYCDSLRLVCSCHVLVSVIFKVCMICVYIYIFMIVWLYSYSWRLACSIGTYWSMLFFRVYSVQNKLFTSIPVKCNMFSLHVFVIDSFLLQVHVVHPQPIPWLYSCIHPIFWKKIN